MKNSVIFLLFLLLVVLRYFSSRPVYNVGDTLRVSGKVTTEPTSYDFSQRVSLLGLSFYLPNFPEVGYGDVIVVEGKVAKDKSGKRLILDNPKLVSLKTSEGKLISFRRKVIAFYRRSLPEPHSSLVAGVALGSKSNIPEVFWNSLKKSGTAHVVVASGTNVTLVAGFAMGIILLFFRRRVAVVASIAVIWLYAVMAGFDAPIVRAAVMGSLLFVSQIFGRMATGLRILVISALTMLVVRPDWLGDLGFWMSFTATASLMLFGKTFDRLFRKVPSLLREGLSTSFAAQIGVAPILYYAFGYVSIWSPFVNMLVLWVIPYITVVGIAAGLVGVVFGPLGQVALYLIYPLTSWFVWIINLF